MAVWLVVGLGNPGPTCTHHRHNVGFMVLDELARRAGVGWGPARLRAEVAETRLTAVGLGGVGADAQRIVLLRPKTYMNRSGGPVARAVGAVKVAPANVVVVHDELDLDRSAAAQAGRRRQRPQRAEVDPQVARHG